jgi:Family of unknown function (DUF5996)
MIPPRTLPAWPELPYEAWKPTKETLHRYFQIVGKTRMALTPARNHWWHVTLYVTERGATTGPMPYGERDVAVDFDFLEHRLQVRSSDGGAADFPLSHRPACADFFIDFFDALNKVGVNVDIHPEAFDLGNSPALDRDRVNASYDADAVERYWRILASTQRVLSRLQSSFLGKASPIHVFWHSFDLAHARYSGRSAPVADGADPVSAEAYSHEVIAFGFWPGDEKTTPYPAFYSYTAPEPEALRERPLAVAGAEWQDTGNGSLAILPYDAMRAAVDPDEALLNFFNAAYLAGARSAGWDIEALARGGGKTPPTS